MQREGLSSANGMSITSAARVLAIGTANRCVDREGGRGNTVAVAQAARLSRAHRSIRVCLSQQRRLRSALELSIASAASMLAIGAANRYVDREGGRGNAVAVAQAARLSRAHRSICVCISQQRRFRSAWELSIAGTAGVLAVSAADHEEVCGEGCAIAVAWAARLGDC